jgi:hypothetical protein
MEFQAAFPIEVESDDREVMVELDWIGEGWEGDYCEDDPEDDPLLRYTIYRKYHANIDPDKFENLCDGCGEEGEWVQVSDGSYCTQLNALLPEETLRKAAQYILNDIESDVRDLTRTKRRYEELSWISEDTVETE